MSTGDDEQDRDDWRSNAGRSGGLDDLSRRGTQYQGSYARPGAERPPPYAPPPPPGYADNQYGYGQYGAGGYGGNYPGRQWRLPPWGPGSLASPGPRLGARLLDALFMIPWIVLSFVVSWATIHPWPKVLTTQQFGPDTSSIQFSPGRFFLWVALSAALVLVGFVVYETAFTHRMGRTPGKAIVHIRPQWTDGFGTNLTVGRAAGRSAAYLCWNLIPYVGGILALIDVLSCLWDQNRQCWHDKLCSTVVVNDS